MLAALGDHLWAIPMLETAHLLGVDLFTCNLTRLIESQKAQRWLGFLVRQKRNASA